MAAVRGLSVGCDLEFLVDSGAGETIVTPEVAAQWGAPERESIQVVDANQRVIQAAGGAPLYGWVHDVSGARVRVLLARRAFTGPSFGTNLFSLGAAHSTGCGSAELTVDRPVLVMGDGVRVPLTKADNTWTFKCQIEPWSSVEPWEDGHDPGPGVAPRQVLLSVPLKVSSGTSGVLDPFARRARQPMVSWPAKAPAASGPGLSGVLAPAASGPGLSGASVDMVSEASAGSPLSAAGASAPSSAPGVAAVVAPSEAAALRRARREACFVYHHRVFNHRDAVVKGLMEAKLIDAVEPPGWRCPACEVAKVRRTHFGASGREAPATPLPWARVECDLYGPIKCGDRNGFEYLFALICVSTGAVFLQPLRAKSEAVAALWAFAKWFKIWASTMEAALQLPLDSLRLGEYRSDRGGEFTTTWGATKSAFDEAVKAIFLGRWLGSPDAPRSATPHIERFWGTLRDAADASECEAGMDPAYKFYAMAYAAQVYNRSPTLANAYGAGQAPFTTLGLPVGLERLVPFGNPCVVARPSPEKGKQANRRGRILGLPSDTSGYIVLLDPLAGASPVASEVITSNDVTPRRGGAPWGTDAEGRPAPVEGSSDAGPHTGFVPFPSREEAAGVAAAEAASPVPAVSRAPVRQSVGTAPGDAGSRHALLDRADRAAPTRGVAAALPVDEALALITDAMMNGKTFVFIQPNPKRGKSAERYAVYSAETTFAGLAALRGQCFAGTSRPVLVGDVTARSGDFVNDVCRRYVDVHRGAAACAGGGGRCALARLHRGSGRRGGRRGGRRRGVRRGAACLCWRRGSLRSRSDPPGLRPPGGAPPP